MNKVVYTVAVGDYIPKNPEIINKEWDHVCFCDRKIKSKCWEIKIFNDNLDIRRLSRKPKLLNDEFLPEYDLSVYVDSTFIIRYDLDLFVKQWLCKCDMAMMVHPKRNCLYDEAKFCIDHNIDDPKIIRKQINLFKLNGFPSNFGLHAGGIIIRKHNIIFLREFMESWWDLVRNGSCRDQLSFDYLRWKKQLKLDEMPFKKIYNDLK